MAASRLRAAVLVNGLRTSCLSRCLVGKTTPWLSSRSICVISEPNRHRLVVEAFSGDHRGNGIRAAAALCSASSAAVSAGSGSIKLSSEAEESRTKSKWPSPTLAPGSTQQGHKVYLSGIGSDVDIATLKKALSQFGEVLSVNIPLLNRYRESPTRYTHRYGFADFADMLGKEKALTAKAVFYGNSQQINIADAVPTTQKRSSKTLYVEGFPAALSEEELVKYFSKFGKVLKATKVNMRNKVVAFVDYELLEDASKAVQSPTHVLAEKTLTVAASTSRGSVSSQQVIMADNLPTDVTVDHLFHYFSKFGSIKQVNLVLHGLRKLDPRNYAFVIFDASTDVSKLIDTPGHQIRGHEISIKKSFKGSQSVNRASKVFIEGLSESVTEEQLMEHFGQVVPVKHANILKEVATGKKNGTAVVEFDDAVSAAKVAESVKHTIAGSDVLVRRLGLSGL